MNAAVLSDNFPWTWLVVPAGPERSRRNCSLL